MGNVDSDQPGHHPSWAQPSIDRLFQLYKVCMARVCVRTPAGDLANGAAFHIGAGYLVTARHCVAEGEIETIVPEHYAEPSEVSILKIFFPEDPRVDLAIMKTDFSLKHFMSDRFRIVEGEFERPKIDHVPLSDHLDDWLGDEFLLTRVLTMGYPAVPLSSRTQLVASVGEVNAVIDRYDDPHPHFVVSTIGRGGFSGGPVISEYGFLLGVYTGVLTEGPDGLYTGLPAALTIEPLLNLMYDNGIFPGQNGRLLKDLYGVFEDPSLDLPSQKREWAEERARLEARRSKNPWYTPGALEH